MILSTAFAGLAPYRCFGFIKEYYGFMSSEVWRPGFVIICGLLGFTGSFDHPDANVAEMMTNIAAYVCIVLGIFMLIIDILGMCCACLCCGKSTDGE